MCFYWCFHRIMRSWLWEICKTTNVYTCHLNIFICMCVSVYTEVMLGLVSSVNPSHTQIMLGLVFSVNSCVCVMFTSSYGVKCYLDIHFHARLSIVFILVLVRFGLWGVFCFFFLTRAWYFLEKNCFSYRNNTHFLFTHKATL